ncbi:MAG: hypothetical protein CMB64_04995 [Euryarchaeota archaeon]|nr:hypothetical protein [Euryarchaeota archaeon]
MVEKAITAARDASTHLADIIVLNLKTGKKKTTETFKKVYDRFRIHEVDIWRNKKQKTIPRILSESIKRKRYYRL